MLRPRQALPVGTSGAGMIEYLIVLVLIALGALAAFRFFGGEVNKKYECSGDAVDRMGGGVPTAGCEGSAQKKKPLATPPPSAKLPDVPPPATPQNQNPPATPPPSATPRARPTAGCDMQWVQCIQGGCGQDPECRTTCDDAYDECRSR